MTTRQVLVVLLLAGMALSLAGCSKVTKGNYDKIKNDMTKAEVENILGKGEDSGGKVGVGDVSISGAVTTWTDGDKQITVTFVNDKVTAKAQKGL